MSSSISDKGLRILGIEVTSGTVNVELNDGRLLALPLRWYPSLLNATESQRANWRLLGGGKGVHWPELDEDLSLMGFLNGWPAPGSEEYSRRRV